MSLFDFLSGDSPAWRPRVSCRKSTYDAWLCGGENGRPGEVNRVRRRGELRVKGEGKSWRTATMDSVLFYLKSDTE